MALTDIFTPRSPCCCIMSFCECLEGECSQQVFSTELGHSPGCPRPAHGSTAKTRQALFWLCLLLPITGSSPRRQYLHHSNGALSVRCLSSWRAGYQPPATGHLETHPHLLVNPRCFSRPAKAMRLFERCNGGGVWALTRVFQSGRTKSAMPERCQSQGPPPL